MQTLSSEELNSLSPAVSTAVVELRVANLRKAFQSPTGRQIEVLRDVSFSVAAGQMVAITGASGAGKSTLLYLLGGLEVPDGGSIGINPSETGRTTPPDLWRPGTDVGFVFQSHYLLADLTALENVVLPLMIARTTGKESRQRAADALRAIGLGDRLDHKIGYLSGGEQQRVAVARALVTGPMLVLADEPTGNLDASIADQIGALLVDYCHRQQAIIVVATHNQRLAELCDRCLVLEQGTILEV